MDDRQKELSASEKLLELIRADKAELSSSSAQTKLMPLGRTPASAQPIRNSPAVDQQPIPDAEPLQPAALRHEPASAPARQPETASRPRPHSSVSRWKLPFSLPARTNLSIGVDIDQDWLRLVRIQLTGNRSRLLDHVIQPLRRKSAPGQAPEEIFADQEIKTLLGRQLQRLCPDRKGAIWTVLPSRHVDIVPVSIPRGLSGSETIQAVFWAAKKKAEFSNGRVLDFTLLPELSGGNSKTQVLAFLADRQYIERLRSFFEETGFQLTGVTLSSLAIQNLFGGNWIEGSSDGLSSLLLEDEKAHVDLYYRHQLIFSREIKTGLCNLSDSEGIPLADNGGLPAAAGISPGSAPEDEGLVMESHPAPETAVDQPAVSRLVRQIERTFEHCAANLGVPKPQHLFLSGGSTIPADFKSHLESELGIPCSFIDPFAAGRLFLGSAIPPSTPGHRRQLAVAAGLALAESKQGQNFLCTRSDRAERKKINATNLLILACSLFLLAGISFGSIWQNQILKDRRTQLAELQKEIAAIPLELVAGPALLKTAATARDLRKTREDEAKRFHALAIIGDLVHGLPEEVKLSKLIVEGQPSGKESEGRTLLQGLIVASPQQKDFYLARFLRKAGNAPLAHEARLTGTGQVRIADIDLHTFAMVITRKPPEQDGARATAAGSRQSQKK